MARFLFAILLFLPGMYSRGQAVPALPPEDTLISRQLDDIVVTATRTDRQVSSLPMPVSVIDLKTLRNTGGLRLDQVLQEFAGFNLVTNFGQGIQVQGLDPQYTLILLNGQPLIGRLAGTLDLSRIAVGNIRKIEIVKGPSSSLYGSEALAGVVNIITDQSRQDGAEAGAQAGSFSTYDMHAQAYLSRQKWQAQVFADRYYTRGFDFTPESYGDSDNPLLNHTAQASLQYRPFSRTTLDAQVRWYGEEQTDAFTDQSGVAVAGDGQVRDLSALGKWKQSFGLHWRSEVVYYAERYSYVSSLYHAENGSDYDRSEFSQVFQKPEILLHYFPDSRNRFTFGSGAILDRIRTTRYDEEQSQHNYFLFAQHEWTVTRRWNLVSGLRYDRHQAFRSQLSPKASCSYQLNPKLLLRASAGVGFKAPDFRQLYLDYSNPAIGYSLLGALEVAQGIRQLQENGEIAALLADISAFGALRPESSLSFHMGGEYQEPEKVQVSWNLFRNDIRNLIEYQPIAIKTNGQSVYSYRNIGSIYTMGLEASAWIRLHQNWSLRAGYQYVDAMDKSVLELIRKGEFFRRNPETQLVERVSRRDYGGLFNRSRHAANLQLILQLPRNGWNTNIRAIWRGRFGFQDRNDNSVLDADAEYAPGHLLLNWQAGKQVGESWEFRGGVNNLLNYRDGTHLPNLQGRSWYLGFRWRFRSKQQQVHQ